MARRSNGGLRKVCGCPHKKWPTCHHSWYFSFQWRGVHHRFSLDRHLGQQVIGKTEARAEADKIRAAIRRGQFAMARTDETPSAPKRLTLDAFSDLYLERARPSRIDQKQIRPDRIDQKQIRPDPQGHFAGRSGRDTLRGTRSAKTRR